MRVPYYIGDLKRDPNLGNYPKTPDGTWVVLLIGVLFMRVPYYSGDLKGILI